MTDQLIATTNRTRFARAALDSRPAARTPTG